MTTKIDQLHERLRTLALNLTPSNEAEYKGLLAQLRELEAEDARRLRESRPLKPAGIFIERHEQEADESPEPSACYKCGYDLSQPNALRPYAKGYYTCRACGALYVRAGQ